MGGLFFLLVIMRVSADTQRGGLISEKLFQVPAKHREVIYITKIKLVSDLNIYNIKSFHKITWNIMPLFDEMTPFKRILW